ncbi:hypothetical protein [Filimonas lacunae]|nr:hypothetical protein [Filimonas lacunae]
MGIYEQILEMEKDEVKAKIVTNLLCDTDHSIQTIAKLVDVPVDFVIEIKNELPAGASNEF